MFGTGQTQPHGVQPTDPSLPSTPGTEKARKNRQDLLGISLSLNHARGGKFQGNKVREKKYLNFIVIKRNKLY